jgi:hypothetical protein
MPRFKSAVVQPLLGRQACNRLYIKLSTAQIFVDVSTNKTSFDGMTCVSWHVHVRPWFTSNTGEKRDGETEGRNVIEMRRDEMKEKKRRAV